MDSPWKVAARFGWCAAVRVSRYDTLFIQGSGESVPCKDGDGDGAGFVADGPAGAVREGVAGRLDLAAVRPLLELPDELHQLACAGRRAGMAAREQAPGRIDGHRAAQAGGAVAQHPQAVAARREADLLGRDQLGHRGSVVYLEDVDVLR